MVLIFPTFYAMSGGLPLRWMLDFNFSVAVRVGYIAQFGIAVETGVVMVVYLDEAFQRRLALDAPMTEAGLMDAVIEGAVQRLRPKLMTVTAVILSLASILWETGIGSDVMKPIAALIVGGMITSTIHVLILVPVFFLLIKRRALRRGYLGPSPDARHALREANKRGDRTFSTSVRQFFTDLCRAVGIDLYTRMGTSGWGLSARTDVRYPRRSASTVIA